MRSSLALAEERPLSIPCGDGYLLASLSTPAAPMGVALIAADSGYSRQTASRRALARTIRDAGFATLMVDLVAPDEESPEAIRVDVEELAGRLHVAREWLRRQPGLGGLPLSIVGLGGAGAAALCEAGVDPHAVRSLVVDCRWPDRAGRALDRVSGPVLFVAEQRDLAALHRIAAACDRLRGERGLATVAGRRSGRTAVDRALSTGRFASSWLAEHGRAATWPTRDVSPPRAERRGAR